MEPQPVVTKIVVPSNVVVKCKGFSVDFGGSVIKLVYRTKEEYDDASRKTENKSSSSVSLTTFPRSDFDAALGYIKKHAYLSRDEDGYLNRVFTTGVGCSQNRDQFVSDLKCRIENIAEFDCFVYSFHYLTSCLSREQILYPLDKNIMSDVRFELIKEATLAGSSQYNAFANISANIDENAVEELILSKLGDAEGQGSKRGQALTTAEDIFPCMIGMLGSAFGYIKVEKDGKFEMVDGSNRGGRTFLGLGNMLTGSKSYEELMEFAVKGDPKKMNMNVNDVLDTTEGNDPDAGTSQLQMQNRLLHCFGKAADKSHDEFDKADIVAALAQYCILDTVQNLGLTTRVFECKHLFLAGSFPSHPYFRSVMTREFTRRNISEIIKGREPLRFDFVKAGGHLGALGALINTVDEFLKVPSEVKTSLKS